MASTTATFSGFADFSAIGNKKPQRAARGYAYRVDIKRVLAISAVIVVHTILFGVMLLPSKPMAPVHVDVPEKETWWETEKLPPPPEKPIEIEEKPIKVEVIQVQPQPPAPAPPIEISPPTIAILSSGDEFVPNPLPTVVDPSPNGGRESSGESPLVTIKAPPPPFPPFAKRGGIVEFRVLVGADGTPERVELVKSSGDRKLDRLTLSHIKRRWRFKAPEVNGAPVQSWGRGKVSFVLEG